TRFISPTKTLEYMAAKKPIVSTPITDVVEPYGQIVHIGQTPQEFIAACEQALAWNEQERETRLNGYAQVLARTSWDQTASAMLREIKRLKPAAPPPPKDESAPVVIIGAGPTGLSAAYHLGDDALLLERNDRVGG